MFHHIELCFVYITQYFIILNCVTLIFFQQTLLLLEYVCIVNIWQQFPMNNVKGFWHSQYQRGPNQVFGKTEEYDFLSVKKVKTKFLSKLRNED